MAGAACRRGSASTASDLLDASAVVADARRAAHLPSHQLIGANFLTQPQVDSTSLASP